MEALSKINEGFKLTKFGWLPEDWAVTPLKKVVQLLNGYAFKPDDWKTEGKPIIRIQNLNDSSAPYNYSVQDLEDRYHVKGGDLLFAWSGTKGVSFGVRIWQGPDAYLNQHIFKVIFDESLMGADFGYLALQKVQDSIERNAHGFKSSFVHVKKGDLEKTLLPVPPLSEQKLIAACLGTWDMAINTLSQLVAQKEERKKRLMQQLLTGKKRLPGFDEEWSHSKLGEYFKERKETGYIDLPLLSVGEAGVYPQTDSNKKDSSNEDKSKYKRICPGDIGYNTMRMWQGRNALSQLEGIISPAYTVVKPKAHADASFFSYLFKLPEVVHKFYQNSQGMVSDTLNCKFKDFAIVKVAVPPTKEEQATIAQVLKIADAEIDLLNQKREKLKEQKKGLMQLLLTGKKRLINI